MKLFAKIHTVLFLGILSCPGTLSAAIYIQNFTSDFADNGMIPDGDYAGWQNSQVVALESGLRMTDLAVTLELSGGWNGDLYVTLRHETIAGTGFAVLLDRVGTSITDTLGYTNTGFGLNNSLEPFRLSDLGTYSVHYYQDHAPDFNSNGQLTGLWRPDGGPLTSFQGLDPNGTWTLFVADCNGGDVGTINQWGLEITAVPEPVGGAWVISVLTLGVGLLLRRWRLGGYS